MRQEKPEALKKKKASQKGGEEPEITIRHEPGKVTESEKGPQKSMDEAELPAPKRDVNRVKRTGILQSDALKTRKERVEDDELVIPVPEPEEVRKRSPGCTSRHMKRADSSFPYEQKMAFIKAVFSFLNM